MLETLTWRAVTQPERFASRYHSGSPSTLSPRAWHQTLIRAPLG
ncbi:hypothetical protein ACIQMV_21830 [Streptomyces sp. NPDC091412]